MDLADYPTLELRGLAETAPGREQLADAAGAEPEPGADPADPQARAAARRHRAGVVRRAGRYRLFAAAELLGEEGRLYSTDFSAGMVEVARRAE
jgi:hypothetical protein